MPKPKPFKRPSIEVGRTETRVWKPVSPRDVVKGDTVAGVGLVDDVICYSLGNTQLVNITGEEFDYPEGSGDVLAFVRVQ